MKMIQEPRKLTKYETLEIIDKQSALNRQVDNYINPLKLIAIVIIFRLLQQCREEMTQVLMVTWMLMLLHVDSSCVRESENSSCTFQYIDVLKFKNKISIIIILTISKINFLFHRYREKNRCEFSQNID